MQDIRFDTGAKTYSLNGREVTINITDPGILSRITKAEERIEALRLELDGRDDAAALDEISKAICEILDETFAAPISAAAFAGVNVLSPVGGGTLFESFWAAFEPAFIQDVTEALESFRQAREGQPDPAEEHISRIISAEVPDISTLTEEQKRAMLAELSAQLRQA